MSLGGVWSSALHAAVQRAVSENVIVLAAAGNCVETVVWPARFPEVIAVAGVNKNDRPWRGSCRGPEVAISALRVEGSIRQAQARRDFRRANVDLVTRRLADLFRSETGVALVCSAACGADIVALEEAERQRLRFRTVLPFELSRFRQTSVTDRGEEWGTRFDRVADLADKSGDLVVLDDEQEDDDWLFAVANSRIRKEAAMLARSLLDLGLRLLAAAVWEGQPRAGNDLTWNFLQAAEAEGFEIRSILTM
jgi:uncharacterized protein (DUF2384 family)